MRTFSSLALFCSLVFFFQTCYSTTVVVDGLAELQNPTVYVGDTLIFKHERLYSLHIFRSKESFRLCNFSQSTLLEDDATNRSSTLSFTWHPSRPGYFYFSYSNGMSPEICQKGEKAAIGVLQKPPEEAMGPSMAGAPPPSSGGVFKSTPALPWRKPLPRASSPGPAPASPGTDSGGGIPFITSNPAVPLPTGEADAATIRPLPTSGCSPRLHQVFKTLRTQLGAYFFIGGTLFVYV